VSLGAAFPWNYRHKVGQREVPRTRMFRAVMTPF
jgi:hypothetical protein